MHLSPTGRRISRRDPKDPIRVAVGKRSAATEHHFSKTGQIRSNHLGYDCYRTGAVNGVGRIRVVLRPGQIPPHLPQDARLLLPIEMWWPQPDHRAAHCLVDAVITFDLPTLRSWKAQWPEHEFGFEQFLVDAERRVVAVRDGNVAPAPEIHKRMEGTGEAAASGTRAPLPKQLAMFPGQPVSVEPQGGYTGDGYLVRMSLVRFDDGQAALRVDVGGAFEDGQKCLCTRAYVDLLDGRFEVVENYPGRLRAFNLPPALIYQVLGLRAPQTPARIVLRPAPGKGSSDGIGRRAVDQTVREAAKIQAVLLSGDPTAEAPKGRISSEPVEGSRRYEAGLRAAQADPDRFPDAPGVWNPDGHPTGKPPGTELGRR